MRRICQIERSGCQYSPFHIITLTAKLGVVCSSENAVDDSNSVNSFLRRVYCLSSFRCKVTNRCDLFDMDR